MEPLRAAISEGERSSLGGMHISDDQEADFMAQLLSNCSILNELNAGSCYFPDISSTSFLVEGDDCLNQVKSEYCSTEESAGVGDMPRAAVLPETRTPVPEPILEDKTNKKRSCISEDVRENKRIAQSKKNQKSNNGEEDNNTGIYGRSSSRCSSEDDDSINASEGLTEGASSSLSRKGPATLNLNGKTRTSKGSANDPMSLYARKRRERINERMRILQNLVPNGTKVDISTMLEEAVQYVKFLELQIKLLVSDDLWMYSPIAYNRFNIGLNLLTTTQRQS